MKPQDLAESDSEFWSLFGMQKGPPEHPVFNCLREMCHANAVPDMKKNPSPES